MKRRDTKLNKFNNRVSNIEKVINERRNKADVGSKMAGIEIEGIFTNKRVIVFVMINFQ